MDAEGRKNKSRTAREAFGFDRRKTQSITDPVDNDPAMSDALHCVVFFIKDQYNTFDMRTTGGMDADYANDRPADDATFVKRLREAGAIILAKGEYGRTDLMDLPTF